MDDLKNIDTVQRLDFDRLDMLVSERIGALKLVAQNIDKSGGDSQAKDMICRDLILPCVHLLAQFIESVKVDATHPLPPAKVQAYADNNGLPPACPLCAAKPGQEHAPACPRHPSDPMQVRARDELDRIRAFLRALQARNAKDNGLFPQVASAVEADEKALSRVLAVLDFYHPTKPCAAEMLRESTARQGHCKDCGALHPQHHTGCPHEGKKNA